MALTFTAANGVDINHFIPAGNAPCSRLSLVSRQRQTSTVCVCLVLTFGCQRLEHHTVLLLRYFDADAYC